MTDANKDVKFSLKVMIHKEKNKVLFAEADSHFVDILLSFLTLPLGTVIKVLGNHYGDEAPTIGSLSSLYHGLANLDTSHFVTAAAKETLLNPTSSCNTAYEMLKLDIADSPPSEFFYCNFGGRRSGPHDRFRSESMYYDSFNTCTKCRDVMKKEVANKGSQAGSPDGVFITHRASFVISDDLQIFPNVEGLFPIITALGITDMDKVDPIKETIGFNEIVSLLKASFISRTPLSDLILKNARKANSTSMKSEPKTLNQSENQENPDSKKIILKLAVTKSCSKLLYAEAQEDFVEFLLSLLLIPLGGVEHIFGGNTCFEAIDTLYRSATVLDEDKYFSYWLMKEKLIKPKLPHGYISKDHILPLAEERLPFYCEYRDVSSFYSVKFPKGQGRYIDGPRTYMVMDDLTVTPFCIHSILSRA